MGVATEPRDARSVGGLLRELRDETVTLFRQEVALAKTEVGEKVSRLTRNSTYMAIGGGVAGAGAMLILLAVAAGLYIGLLAAGVEFEIALWLSPLIVGAVVAVIGYGLIAKGKHTLTDEPMMPEKTVQSLKEDKEWTANKIR